jgi:hypothetical protein
MPERIQGHYSLIQYCPCPARDERMNVGVALLVEKLRYLQTATLAGSQFRDIADQFPRDSTPWEANRGFRDRHRTSNRRNRV